MITGIKRHIPLFLVSVIGTTFLGVSLAMAGPTLQWAEHGVPMVTTAQDQFLRAITTDGHGGVIAVWQDNRRFPASTDIYAQRLSADGQPQWADTGVPTSTITSMKTDPVILSDGQGGAFIVWVNGIPSADIYAQHLSADGQPLWGPNGLPIAVATRRQFAPALTSDGNGGILIVWADERRYIAYLVENDLFAQRVTSDGQIVWAQNGVPVSIAPGVQARPRVMADVEGGAFVLYEDDRSAYYGSTTGNDLFAQRINGAGQILWNSNGVPVVNALGHQRFSSKQLLKTDVMTGDGQGGVIVVWEDARAWLGQEDIYAQRLGPTGQSLWASQGVPVSQAVGGQWSPQLTTDGAGGAIITWDDRRKGGNLYYGEDAPDVYAQRLNAMGQPLWAQDGLAITLQSNWQVYPAIASDGHGGAIIAWQSWQPQTATSRNDMYAQRLTGNGQFLWPIDGLPISHAIDDQDYPVLLGDHDGGAIVAWSDHRTGWGPDGSFDIYAQQISDAMPVNRAPEFVPVPLISMKEGGRVDLIVTAHDPDEDPLGLSAANLPAFAIFTDLGNGQGRLSLEPGYDDAGPYTVELTADDGRATTTLPIEITVTDVNRPPSFVGLTAQQLAECATLTLPVTAVDPDSDPITAISASQLPAGATLVNHTLSWTPTAQQADTYTVLLTASDGRLTTEYPLLITVAQTPYGFSGFLPPLSETSPNRARLGSTVPVKFRLSVCGPDQIVRATVWVQPFVSGQPAGVRQPARATDKVTVGNMITNTDGTKLFHYNLKTLGLTKGFWQIQVDLDDGTTHAVMLLLR
jgi:hypothetical protein